MKPDSSCLEKLQYNPPYGGSKSCPPSHVAFLLPLPGEIKDNPRSAKTLQEGNLREDIEGRKGTHVFIGSSGRVYGIIGCNKGPKESNHMGVPPEN